MITRPGDNKPAVTGENNLKRKAGVSVPTDNAVAQSAGAVLKSKAGVNLKDKKKLEKQHFLIMGAGVGFMVLSFIITGMINGSRTDAVESLSREISQLSSKIAIQDTAGSYYEQASVQESSVGLDNEVMSHDSELIAENLHSMLDFDLGEAEVVRDSVRHNYSLMGADNNVMRAFYPGSAKASRLDEVIVYCRNPGPSVRSYACEITWTTTSEFGDKQTKSGLFLCNVANDTLSALDVWVNN